MKKQMCFTMFNSFLSLNYNFIVITKVLRLRAVSFFSIDFTQIYVYNNIYVWKKNLCVIINLVLGQIPLEAKRGRLFSSEKTRGWTLRTIYVEVRVRFEYQINVFDSIVVGNSLKKIQNFYVICNVKKLFEKKSCDYRWTFNCLMLKKIIYRFNFRERIKLLNNVFKMLF